MEGYELCGVCGASKHAGSDGMSSSFSSEARSVDALAWVRRATVHPTSPPRSLDA